MRNDEKNKSVVAQIYARCWSDETYKMKFLENPKMFLTEAGFDFGGASRIKVHQNTTQAVYRVLPKEISPESGNMIGEQFSADSLQIPEDFEVRFVRNTDETLNLVLPLRPQAFSDELTEGMLSGIAGGTVEAVATTSIGGTLTEVVVSYNLTAVVAVAAIVAY